jgi:hypothetical protein
MEHEYDILDIEWAPKTGNKDQKSHLLLSSSFDSKVILWDLNKDKPI